MGNKVSVDHIFLRLVKMNGGGDRRGCVSEITNNYCPTDYNSINHRCAALALGYLDTKGTRILNVHRDDILIEGRTVLSDHRPVTATIAWPRIDSLKETSDSDLYVNVTMPLDPLEPAWGIVN